MNFNQIKYGKIAIYIDGIATYLKGAMVWGFKSFYKWGDTSADVWGFANPNDIDPEAQAVYDRIIAIPNGFSNLSRLNYFVKGLKTIYGSLSNVPVCYDAHWIGGVLGSGVGATAGQACARLCSLTVAGDAVQATASAQPLLLTHGGAASDNYWYGSGVAGNYVSTPNAAANQITGDIEIIAKVGIVGDSGFQTLVSKWTGTSLSFIFQIAATNLLRLYINTAGSLATSTIPISTSFNGYLKVTRAYISGDVKFYTSSDGVSYTQLGATLNINVGAIISSSASVEVGSYNTGTGANFSNKIYRATISNSIGGAPVVDFNPTQYNAATSQKQWTSSTGEVWTINTGTAATGYKGVLVDRTIVQGDGVDDNMKVTGLTSRQYYTKYVALNNLSFSGRICGGNSDLQQIIYGTAANTSMFGGSGGFDFVGEVAQRVQMFTANFAAAPNVYNRINNAARATIGTSIGNATSTGVTIFSDGNNTNYANITLLTYIDSITNDPQTDATYNFIRSLNNNAF